MHMETHLLPDFIRTQLIDNCKLQYKARGMDDAVDFEPVARLYCPGTDESWLLTSLDPETDVAACLWLHPKEAYVTFVEMSVLANGRGPEKHPVLYDANWRATKTLSHYASDYEAMPADGFFC